MDRVRQYGFTLVELMITLTVAVVLILLVTPSFRDLIDKSRLRGATDDLVNLLNVARADAIRQQHDVNVSVNATNWCAWEVAAPAASTVGNPIPSATACDCSASVASCTAGTPSGLIASSSYSGAQISSVSNSIKYVDSTSGVIFNAKLGALNLASLPVNPLLKVTSPSGRFSTQISLSPLGQVTVCVPSTSPFVSGYPSC